MEKIKLGDMTFKQIIEFCSSGSCARCPLYDECSDGPTYCRIQNFPPCSQKELINIEVKRE